MQILLITTINLQKEDPVTAKESRRQSISTLKLSRLKSLQTNDPDKITVSKHINQETEC